MSVYKGTFWDKPQDKIESTSNKLDDILSQAVDADKSFGFISFEDELNEDEVRKVAESVGAEISKVDNQHKTILLKVRKGVRLMTKRA
jgi:hypothetical protein